MQDDNKPAPGSPEHDAMMADRYRNQGKETPLTEDGSKYSSYDTVQLVSGADFQVRRGSTLGPPGPEQYTETQADPGQVADLEREIARVKAELAEVVRHNAATGEPMMRHTGEARRGRELRLAHLEGVELPATKMWVAQAQAWRAENVETPLQQLSREHSQREAIKTRAEEIINEKTAEAEANRLLKSRGLGIASR